MVDARYSRFVVTVAGATVVVAPHAVQRKRRTFTSCTADSPFGSSGPRSCRRREPWP